MVRQEGRIVDLSIGGCYIESLQHPAAGEHVIVSIALEAGQIQIPAEAMYGESTRGFAVRFLDLPAALMDVLRVEVDRRMRGSAREGSA